MRRPTLSFLFAAVGVVPTIACANVATLLLARATAPPNEVAIRAALGAGRGRIVSQLLTEKLILGLFGGCLGAVIGAAGLPALLSLAPVDLLALPEVGVDARVLLFTWQCRWSTTGLFGLVPAMQTSRIDLNETLKRGGVPQQHWGVGRLRGRS